MSPADILSSRPRGPAGAIACSITGSRWYAPAIWLIMGMSALAMPVVAQPPPDAAPMLEPPAEALEADAAAFAREAGLSFAEALHQLQAQEASVATVDRLVERYRDRLAGVVIEHRPVARVIITVTGEPAPDAVIATAPFGLPILLRTGALATRAQTLDAIDRHQAELRAALPAPPGMGVDPRTGALLILARAGELDGDADTAATADRLERIAGVPVEVARWGDVDRDLSVEGGGRVTGGDGEGGRRFTCTAGFVVTDGARTALATAAHCPDRLNYVDGSRGHTPLTMLGAWGARYQDVQIHLAPDALSPLFLADNATRPRTVTSWRNRTSTRAGDIVCHRGQRTGYSCATIRFVDFAPPGDLCAGPCPATWVAVDGPACGGGDSGGPVFLGTVAFGLVKGESAENGACRLYYYMSTDYLPPGWTVAYRRNPMLPPGPADRLAAPPDPVNDDRAVAASAAKDD